MPDILKKENFKKFVGRSKNGISIHKKHIGFLKGFIESNQLESFEYVQMYYDSKKRHLLFHFSNDDNSSKLQILSKKRPSYCYMNLAKSFLEEFNLT